MSSRWLALLAVCGVLAAGCGSDSKPADDPSNPFLTTNVAKSTPSAINASTGEKAEPPPGQPGVGGGSNRAPKPANGIGN